MYQGKISFLDLSNEILCQVLVYCGPEDIAHISQTCRRLRDVATVRSVWAPQFLSLKTECVPLPPWRRLQSFDNKQLRNLVVDAVHLHNLWNRPGRINLVKEREFAFPEEPTSVAYRVKVVPGGREAFVIRDGRAELWSLESQQRIWTVPSPEGFDVCSLVDFDVVNGGKAFTVATRHGQDAQLAPVHGATSVVRLCRFDRIDGQASIISDWTFQSNCIHNLIVRGDYFMVFLLTPQPRAVVNWREEKGTFLEIIGDGEIDISGFVRTALLVNDHFISTINSNDPFLFAMPLDGPDITWNEGKDTTSWGTSMYHARNGPSIDLSVPNPPQNPEGRSLRVRSDALWYQGIHAFQSDRYPPGSMDGDEWEVLHVGHLYCKGYSNWLMVSHRIRLSFNPSSGQGAVLILSDSSAAPTIDVPSSMGKCFFNSGHVVHLMDRVRCYSLLDDGPQPVKELDGSGILPREPLLDTVVDPWSGVIVSITRTSVFTFRLV